MNRRAVYWATGCAVLGAVMLAFGIHDAVAFRASSGDRQQILSLGQVVDIVAAGALLVIATLVAIGQVPVTFPAGEPFSGRDRGCPTGKADGWHTRRHGTPRTRGPAPAADGAAAAGALRQARAAALHVAPRLRAGIRAGVAAG